MNDIRYGVASMHSKREIEMSNGHVEDIGKRNAAEDLGRSIMDKKGWRREEDDDNVYNTQDVYVFTAKELREFVRSRGGTI